MSSLKVSKEKDEAVSFVEEKARTLLSFIGTDAELAVSFNKEENIVTVQIDPKSDDAGLLIGRRGETLLSIQYILSLMLKMLKAKGAEDLRVLVNIGDWRNKQEEILKNLADSTVERVIKTGEEQSLYNLTPSQRRIVHLYLTDNKSVVTESQGEGDERVLVVKPRIAS